VEIFDGENIDELIKIRKIGQYFPVKNLRHTVDKSTRVQVQCSLACMLVRRILDHSQVEPMDRFSVEVFFFVYNEDKDFT